MYVYIYIYIHTYTCIVDMYTCIYVYVYITAGVAIPGVVRSDSERRALHVFVIMYVMGDLLCVFVRGVKATDRTRVTTIR